MAKRGSSLKAFLDSSVLFTAVNSPSGGASKLFTIHNLKLYVSSLVLTEVERNVREKLEDYHLNRFFMLTRSLIIVDQNLLKAEIEKAETITAKKDAPILASAKLANCQIIFSLDIKHFFGEKVDDYLKPAKVLTPKMFFAASPTDQNNY